MTCNCNKPAMPDRIEFIRCSRGFLFQVRDQYLNRVLASEPLYAFDNIQDAASWLVDNYGEKSA